MDEDGHRMADACIPWLDVARVSLDRSAAGVVHQSPLVTLRRGAVAATEIVALSFRSTRSEPNLWARTLQILSRHVFHQPVHPLFVHVIALARHESHASDAAAPLRPACVVMEYAPTSLYDVLHCDGLRLGRSDILSVATQVLSALHYLHSIGQCFGSTLTSRKVTFAGLSHIKLRRVCSEWITRHVAPACSSSSSSSQYMMPGCPQYPEHDLHRAQRQDLYAFGMIVLEMCAHEKPNAEIMNRIATSAHVDTRLERIIRATLAVDAYDATPDGPRSLLQHCVTLLHACSSTDGSHTRQSSGSFASFVHADRYFQAAEAAAIERHVAERLRQSEVALKRLAAVEDELVEEQKSFTVVVNQLEQLRLDKAADEHEIQRLQALLQAREGQVGGLASDLRNVERELASARARIDAANATVEERDARLQRVQTERLVVERERQQLAGEILKLKAEKQQCIDDRLRVEHELALVAAKVGGERDAVVELEARYAQAIRRCEQEQQARRAVERQLEAVNRQLSQMEDDRARYTGELQRCPAGLRDARSAKDLVLALKQKEVDALRVEVDQLALALGETQRALDVNVGECQRLRDVVCVEMEREIEQLRRGNDELQRAVETGESERQSLVQRLNEVQHESEDQRAAISTLESRVDELQRKSADAEKARRMKQCLTPGCDAPRYLVKASGFCVDCEEKMAKQRKATASSRASAGTDGRKGHRRQRSLDGVQRAVNSIKNAPIIDILKRIEVARDSSDDDDPRDEGELDLVGLLKQLGHELKTNGILKEDLPECGAFRTLLSVMEQSISNLAVAMECCKTLSIAVFNTDRNRIIVVADGVVELLLKAMRVHQHETKLVELGAVLLTNLAHNCETNRQRIVAAGGVDTILEAMQRLPRHTAVQKKACWALLTLAGSDSTCQQIAALGGVGATIAAMLNCPADGDVQHYGSWALLNLVAGIPHLQQFARREGVVEVAEAALVCFPAHAGVQDKCRQLLDLVLQTSDSMSS